MRDPFRGVWDLDSEPEEEPGQQGGPDSDYEPNRFDKQYADDPAFREWVLRRGGSTAVLTGGRGGGSRHEAESARCSGAQASRRRLRSPALG